jgi:molybdopterin molybdotransferase
MLPPGTDAVVMQEEVTIDAGQADMAIFREAAKPWEGIRFCGSDVIRTARLTQVGAALTAPRLGLLAAQGYHSVRVYPQPSIGFIATGDELREPDGSLMPGQIYESNRVALGALAERAGAKARIYPLVPDELEATKAALEQAFAECDAVATTGGVSVGERDFVKAAFAELGGQIDFWKIAIKPGKPFVFGQWNGKPLFGLPGNPVSAFVTFFLLVCPAVKIMLGGKNADLPCVTRRLSEALANEGDRRHFMRVWADGKEARSAGPQASHCLGSLAAATGLVDVPPNTTLPAGTEVEVLYW